MEKFNNIHNPKAEMVSIQKMQFVLFGIRVHLTLHLERSPLIHSYDYDSAGDRPTCFASYTLIPKSFVQYAG